jgi:DNA polymerase eta
MCMCHAGELAGTPLAQLQRLFGEDDGRSLHEMAHGIDREAVKPRTLPKSIGCGKSFTGHLQLMRLEKVPLHT